MKATFLTILTLLNILIFNGCHNSTELNADGIPGKLIIAMYVGDTPGQTKAAMAQMKKYLEK